ncbi:hypothetical protein ACKERD_17315, partial [Acinetobacter baumannii]
PPPPPPPPPPFFNQTPPTELYRYRYTAPPEEWKRPNICTCRVVRSFNSDGRPQPGVRFPFPEKLSFIEKS